MHTPQFVRTPLTWLCYLLLGYFALLQTSLNVLIPFLREEMGLTYSVSSLHLTLFAAGAMSMGLVGERVVRAWGRRATLWRGALGMTVAALVILLSRQVAVSLPLAALMGMGGSLLMLVIQSSLSDSYGPQRGIALAEANTAASLAGVIAPMWIGVGVSRGWGWRWPVIVALLALLPIAVRFSHVPVPNALRRTDAARDADTPLPASFWAYAVVLFLIVALEWGVVVWAATYLQVRGGLTAAAAAQWVTVYFAAMIVGRFAGSRLARRLDSTRLLVGSLVVTLVGFPLFWLSPVAAWRVLGLFITGLGIANQYPSTMANASEAAGESVERGIARLGLIGGSGILVLPFVLGWLGDRLGLQTALGVIGVLLLLSLAMIGQAERLKRRPPPASTLATSACPAPPLGR